jgi:hypothetical protein
MTPTEVEYITEADAVMAERLCGAISEIVCNWMKNNDCTDPFIVLTALGRAVNHTVAAAPCGHCRNQAATAVIEMILALSDVEPVEVMREVALLNHGSDGRKLDA